MNRKASGSVFSQLEGFKRLALASAGLTLLISLPAVAQVTATQPSGASDSGAGSFTVLSTANTSAGVFNMTGAASTADTLFAETLGNGWAVYGRGKKNGVYGIATKNSGTTYGVRGKVNSPDGWAGYFEGRGYFSGNVGIGVSAPAYALDVNGTASMTGFRLTTGAANGRVLKSDATGVGTWQTDSLTLPFSGSSSGGDSFSITHTGGNDAGVFTVDNTGGGGEALEASNNGSGITVLATNTGTGQAGWFVINNASNDKAALYATTNGTGYTVRGVHTGSSGNAGRFEIDNASNAGAALYVTTNGTGNAIYVLHSGDSDNAGEFYISNSANSNGVIYAHTDGTGRGGTFEINNSSNTSSAVVALTNGTGNGVYAENSGTSNNAGEFYISNANNASSALYCHTDGTGPALWADGTAKVDVLEITGADVAEKFPTSEEMKPGMVVAIDPKNPGQLCLSRQAYNHRVAGVVSGANDLPVGAVLGNLPGNEKGVPIALSGRVWVYCDATKRAIEPGDLLTTAERPGYAMAVANHIKAQGAILGKAMTSLKKGETGMVLVLVNLQ